MRASLICNESFDPKDHIDFPFAVPAKPKPKRPRDERDERNERDELELAAKQKNVAAKPAVAKLKKVEKPAVAKPQKAAKAKTEYETLSKSSQTCCMCGEPGAKMRILSSGNVLYMHKRREGRCDVY